MMGRVVAEIVCRKVEPARDTVIRYSETVRSIFVASVMIKIVEVARYKVSR